MAANSAPTDSSNSLRPRQVRAQVRFEQDRVVLILLPDEPDEAGVVDGAGLPAVAESRKHIGRWEAPLIPIPIDRPGTRGREGALRRGRLPALMVRARTPQALDLLAWAALRRYADHAHRGRNPGHNTRVAAYRAIQTAWENAGVPSARRHLPPGFWPERIPDFTEPQLLKSTSGTACWPTAEAWIGNMRFMLTKPLLELLTPERPDVER